MSRHRPLIGALAVAAVLVAGCGSSSDDSKPAAQVAAKPAKPAKPSNTGHRIVPDSKPAGPRPNKATYLRRADAVCTEAKAVSAKANKVVQQAFAANQAIQAAEAIDTYGPQYLAKVQKLHELKRPAGSNQTLNNLLKIMDVQVATLVAESRALRTNDSTSLQNVTKAQQEAVSLAETLGKKYGFKVCGRAIG
jgi:hypothetical protein